MHFTYEPSPEGDVLSQGDVLRRTPELELVLKQYYSYFGDNDENQFFLVITQSCDLVPRIGGACKAKYIELAAVRPLRVVIQRELATHTYPGFDLPFPVAGTKGRTKLEQFLERLFNNNEQDYFFLCREPTAGLPEEYCAFLHLTVPIKAEHYKTCLQSRILSLNTVFQAKLGWLVGQIYARVGTSDWTQAELRKRVQDVVNGSSVWIDDKLQKPALDAVVKWKQANPDTTIDEAQLRQLIGKLPRKKDLAVERIEAVLSKSNLVTRLTQEGAMTAEDLRKVIKQVSSDQNFTAICNLQRMSRSALPPSPTPSQHVYPTPR